MEIQKRNRRDDHVEQEGKRENGRDVEQEGKSTPKEQKPND